MDMTRATIIGGNILDELWPEIALVMVHVRKLRPSEHWVAKVTRC